MTAAPAVTLAAWAVRVRWGAPVDLEVQVDPSVAAQQVLPATEAALTRATLEALRNVARHSGTARAELVLSGTRHGLVVRVVDHGRGLPDGVEEGFGLTHSVREVIGSVGGSVSLASPPGGGTTVTLSLPRPPRGRLLSAPSWARSLAQAHALTLEATGENTALARSIGWPLLAAWTYLAVRHSLTTPRSADLLVLAACFAVVTVLVLRRLERRAPSWPWLLVVCAVLVGLQVAGLALLPAGALLDYRSWSVGFTAAPVMLLCLFLPVPVALVVMGLHPVVILTAVVVDPALSGGSISWGSLNGALTTPLVAVVLGLLLRRAGAAVREERTRLGLATEALARHRSSARISSVHLEHTARAVLPWLEEVASGRVDLDDPTTAEHARLLGLEARDDLYAAGVLDPAVREHVRLFRRRGGTLEVRPGFTPGAARVVTVAVLTHLMSDLPAGSRVTVSPLGAEEQVRLAILPAAPWRWEPRPDLPEPLHLDVDEFRTVVVLHDVPRPGSSREGALSGRTEP